MIFEDLKPELCLTQDLWCVSIDEFLSGAQLGHWKDKSYIPSGRPGTPVLVIGRWFFASPDSKEDQALLGLADGKVIVIPMFSLAEIREDTISLRGTYF